MTEHSFSFGENNRLVGTLCLPDTPNAMTASAGVILFNAGIVHRIGPHRINVKLARTLAKMGIPSIRFDLAGLGDSGRPSGERGFEAQAIHDIQTAMTALGDHTGLKTFGLFGFCSGAYHSYHTSLADQRVIGIQLFDAYRYPTLRSRMNRWALRMRRHGILQTIARILVKPAQSIAAKLQALGKTGPKLRASQVGFIVDTTSKEEFAKGIQSLLNRSVDISMIFSGDGFELYNYANQFNDAFKRYGIVHRVSTSFLPDIDHVATSRAAQEQLINTILPWAARIASVGSEGKCGLSQASSKITELA